MLAFLSGWSLAFVYASPEPIVSGIAAVAALFAIYAWTRAESKESRAATQSTEGE
jgi:hypothetical protein